jgi:preprotein translocase subunit SecA
MLGSTTEKTKAHSMAEVHASAEFDEKAKDLDDERLVKAARLLELGDLASSADIPQFLAIAREAAERTTGLRPFDVQLAGALRMLAGDVIEMATGEGKTLSGAIAAAGYALGGRNVHVVTINDYLARRDAEWMGPLIEAMGLTVGWITAESTAAERRTAYECDVTYASVNEIGFDVLRDQLVTDVADLVSPNPDVALIDEADSVLVDEALVPLVLAGTTHRETPKVEIVRLVGDLAAGTDYDTDADNRNVHLTEEGAKKIEAIMEHIVEVHATGQPILVGTHDVAESEELHERLVRRGVPAVVLNAKNDEEEAAVIAEAGKLGTVTVSTQMAGRGTDIRLGGSEETDHDKVAELGGLHVIGTGRHRTERLDNQLRGRAGRQGDPGSSVFFASWEDDVIVAHLDEGKLPTEADETGQITSPKAGSLLDHAQRVAEGRLLDVHANTWRYNQLIAQQRAIIVERRNTLLSTPAARNELKELSPDRYEELAEKSGEERLEVICRQIMLFHLDRGWADHLAYLADIRESIHLRALGRQNPLDEFHRMAVDAFAHLAADAIEAAQQTFETANILEEEQGLDLSKLARPTSTWTYMVHDNPLNDDTLSALSLPGVFR